MTGRVLGVCALAVAAVIGCAKDTGKTSNGGADPREDEGRSPTTTSSSSGEEEELTEEPVGEEPAPDAGVDAKEAPDAADNDATLPTGGEYFEQRYLCRTEPQDPKIFCTNKGHSNGMITKTSSCFRVDDFSVKDVEYYCY